MWHDILFSLLFFCLERTVMVIISKLPFKSYLISAILKVLSQKLWDTSLTMAFERHLTDEDFRESGSTYVLTLSWVNILKRKWTKISWELSVAQTSEPVFLKNIAPKHSTYCCILFFSRINLAFKFKLVLIEWVSPQFI